MVGKGGNSSQVFRGSLPHRKALAVKILKSSVDVLQEFNSEFDITMSINHKHIISLFGFCFEDKTLILVYAFLSRGSLEENLQGNKKDAIAFGWEEGYQVAVAGRFWTSSMVSSASSCTVATDVAGTFGYLAPEYFMHGKVTDKIDLYREPGYVDPSLGSDYDRDQVDSMVLAATVCIRREPHFKPRISPILKLLQGDTDITDWAKQQVNCTSADLDALDTEQFPTDIQRYLKMAFLDIVDDSPSVSSTEHNVSLEEYLNERWSGTLSFD
ncbi:hypothetical protein Ancab_000470 [Ancistrocladus abbreviatus]